MFKFHPDQRVNRFILERLGPALEASKATDTARALHDLAQVWLDMPHELHELLWLESRHLVVLAAHDRGWNASRRPTPPAHFHRVATRAGITPRCPLCGSAQLETIEHIWQDARAARIAKRHTDPAHSLELVHGSPLKYHWSRCTRGQWSCCGLAYWHDHGGFKGQEMRWYRDAGVQQSLFGGLL